MFSILLLLFFVSSSVDSTRFIIFSEEGYGFMNRQGEIVIPPELEEARTFRGNYAPARKNGKWGIIDSDGKWVLAPELTRPPEMYDGKIRFSQGIEIEAHPVLRWLMGNPERIFYGYKNVHGDVIIPPQFSDARHFSNGLAIVSVAGKLGFINTDGEFIIPPQFIDAFQFSEGLAAVSISENVLGFLPFGNSWVYIDTKGSIVIETDARRARSFSEGLASVEKRGKNGYINTRGELVIPHHYELAFPFSNGLARIFHQSRWKFITPDGSTAFYSDFPHVYDFSEGLARFTIDGTWGYIDTNGNIAIPPKYDLAYDFEDGLARVRTGNQWKYIDRDSNVVWRATSSPP